MNNKQQKIIEMYWLVNMHEAKSEDTYLLISNPFNAILTPYLQMFEQWSVHFVSICLTMQLVYRLPLT